MESMYRVEYFCPRQSPYWQPLKGFFGPKTFPSLEAAVMACNPLLWQYHSARVIDPWGNVAYEV